MNQADHNEMGIRGIIEIKEINGIIRVEESRGLIKIKEINGIIAVKSVKSQKESEASWRVER